jgi:phosphotransferase system IIB component
MIRRAMLAVFFVLFVVTSAWPKFKEDEQQYLNDQFKAIQDQVQALTTQLQTLNAQLQVLRQNQAQFQAVIDHQQQALQNLDQLVTSMHLGDEENFSSLKTAITQLRKDTKAAIASLTGVQPGSATAETTKPSSENPPRVLQGYVTDVKGNNVGDIVTLDVGSSSQGIHQGSRLTLFKASDLNTQVGLVEITQVIDAGTSRAQIVTLNPGVRLEWGDVVRLE